MKESIVAPRGSHGDYLARLCSYTQLALSSENGSYHRYELTLNYDSLPVNSFRNTDKGSDSNLPLQGEKLNSLTGVLCDGMFSYADEEKATQIITECLKLCDGSKDTLSQVLQTKYVSNHSPFFWVIANLPISKQTESPRTVPPLLTKFLEICSDLLDDTQNDIVQGLFITSDDALYQLVRPTLPTFATPIPKSFFQGEGDQPEYKVSSGTGSSFELDFKIPRFYDRIIIDKEISYHFVAKGAPALP